MKKQKRFAIWNPQVGEKALVPGNPGNAMYVDVLDQSDVDAINNGHRGYMPMYLKIIGDTISHRHNEVIDIIYYDEPSRHWVGDMVRAKNPSVMLRAARKYYELSHNNVRLDWHYSVMSTVE